MDECGCCRETGTMNISKFPLRSFIKNIYINILFRVTSFIKEFRIKNVFLNEKLFKTHGGVVTQC